LARQLLKAPPAVRPISGASAFVITVNSSMLSTRGVSASCWMLTLFSGSTKTLAAVAGVLGISSLLASFIPARRAASVKFC